MMIDPPIDKLVEKVGCKYALVSLVTKRARYILDKKADMLEADKDLRPIGIAAHEVYSGKVELRNEE